MPPRATRDFASGCRTAPPRSRLTLVTIPVSLKRRFNLLIAAPLLTNRQYNRFLQIYLTPQAPAVTEAPLANFSSPLLDGAVTLTDLNKVLANAFATVYWYGTWTFRFGLYPRVHRFDISWKY